MPSPSQCQSLLCPLPPSDLLILTIVLMDMPTGSLVGLCRRKLGAAKFMAGVALAKLAARRRPSPMIVLQDTQIGWQDGVLVRRLGVARMRARAAHQQLEVVPKIRL